MEIRKPIVVWLIIGLVLVYFQIIIGGITRLTGSGLSITDWDIIFGTIPPIGDAAWQEAFELYRSTPQYAKINEGMEMGSIFQSGTFKFIYFWEYFHRLWARSMGFIFLFPFIFFYIKKWLPSSLLKDLGVVVGLAALAATFGWIMVASGLIERPWVNAYKLSIHLSIGLSVFSYLLWAFVKYINIGTSHSTALKVPGKSLWFLFGFLCLQIFLGGIMSGMKAALIYPTWPEIGSTMVPAEIFDGAKWSLQSFVNYDDGSFVFSVMHFLHRGVAYLLVGLIVWYSVRHKIFHRSDMLSTVFKVFIGLVILQVIVGIVTVVNSIGVVPVFWGVLHQAVAVFVFGSYVIHMYYVRYTESRSEVDG